MTPLRMTVAVVLIVAASPAYCAPEDARLPDARYLGTSPDIDVGGFIHNARSQPDVTNELLRDLYKSIALPRLFDGLDIQPKVFEVDTAGAAGGALGLAYKFSRALAFQEIGRFRNPLDLGLDVQANGNVAFSRNLNPADFLSTSASITARQFVSGLNDIAVAGAEVDSMTALEVAAANFDGAPAELEASPEWRAFKDRLSAVLAKAGTEILWQFGANAALESNQAFTTKQYAYGGAAGLAIRDWHTQGLFHIFDYPFAIVRVLSGAEPSFTPRGDACPSMLLGIDIVDPKDNKNRAVLSGGAKTYPRFRSELQTRARVAKIGDAIMWLDADWRVFQELGASDVIKNANQNVFSYFVATLEMGHGLLGSYANGRLPFDQQATSHWELGWQFKLGE
jgi:hypothetical protein